MLEFENSNATQLAEDLLWDFHYDKVYDKESFPEKEYVMNLNPCNTFYEYTYKYARKNGFDGDTTETDNLAKFIFNLSKKKEATLSSLNTVKNWLKQSPPAKNPTGRNNVYRLCFALGLDEKETKEFFLKAYLDRPFNYKNIYESTYFFCLSNKLPFSKAESIIEKIEAEPFSANEENECITENIGYEISLITTEEDFIKFIVANRTNFASQNQTAKKEVKRLFLECLSTMLKLKEQEKRERKSKKQVRPFQDKTCRKCGKSFVTGIGMSYAYGDYCSWTCYRHWSESPEFNITEINKQSDELLTAITGFYARKVEKGGSPIEESDFPKAISHNFPREQAQFRKIWDGSATYDFIRRAIIMLTFYNFFGEALIKHENKLPQGLFEEFVDETNEILSKCGYVQLYWRNPYDWLFGYCAWAANPLDYFKGLIREYYLKKHELFEL